MTFLKFKVAVTYVQTIYELFGNGKCWFPN